MHILININHTKAHQCAEQQSLMFCACPCYVSFGHVALIWILFFILNYTFRLSETKQFWVCKCALPWMLPPLHITFEYWIGHVTFVPLYVMFRFSTRIFYRGVQVYAWCSHFLVFCWSSVSFNVTPLRHTLQWRHNDRDGVSNHQPHDRLPKRSFRRKSKKTSKFRVTGLCAGNSPVGEIPAQRASNAENVFIWWRHHGHPMHWINRDPHVHMAVE